MITEALRLLRPGAKFTVVNEDYNQIDWLDNSYTKPTRTEVENKVAELVKNYQDTQYQRSRQLEYPPITDYLDGVVKGDEDQINAYIAACQAVKAKYPKPE
jgi:hypothetical protein